MARGAAFAVQINAMKQGLRGSHAQVMAHVAREAFAEAQAINRRALGHEPPFEQFVDGRRNAPLESVKPGGKIVFLFAVGAELLAKAVDQAIHTFLQVAPVGGRGKDKHPGLYRDSLIMLVNGTRRDFATKGAVVELKPDDIVSLTDLQPYARRLERGWSFQAPNGVMEIVTARTRSEFGGVLNIAFSWDSYPGFAVGRTRTGAALKMPKDVKRASVYPTITIRTK